MTGNHDPPNLKLPKPPEPTDDELDRGREDEPPQFHEDDDPPLEFELPNHFPILSEGKSKSGILNLPPGSFIAIRRNA